MIETEKTYQDNRANKDQISREAARLTEPRRIPLQETAVAIQRVRIEDDAELKGQTEGAGQTPYLREWEQGEEDLIGQEDEGVGAEEVDVARDAEREGCRCECPEKSATIRDRPKSFGRGPSFGEGNRCSWGSSGAHAPGDGWSGPECCGDGHDAGCVRRIERSSNGSGRGSRETTVALRGPFLAV